MEGLVQDNGSEEEDINISIDQYNILVTQVKILKNILKNSQYTINVFIAAGGRPGGLGRERFKLNTPNTFDGTPGYTRGFLT